MSDALLTAGLFEPQLGTSFAITGLQAGGSVVLVLTSVVLWGPEQGPEGGRRPFTLTFRGPADPPLPQATYQLDHESLGSHGIFLVPIARGEDGSSYEAVFA